MSGQLSLQDEWWGLQQQQAVPTQEGSQVHPGGAASCLLFCFLQWFVLVPETLGKGSNIHEGKSRPPWLSQAGLHLPQLLPDCLPLPLLGVSRSLP